MSDTMRDAAWKLVPVEPTEQMIEAGRHVKRMRLLDSVKAIRAGRDPEELMGKTAGAEYRAMLEAAPAPPAPSSVQEIMRLMNPYVRACAGFDASIDELDDAKAEIAEAFKPLKIALAALVDERDRLKFELDGVNAMRRPMEWISVDERLPEQIDYPYQVVAIAKKAHGKESCYPGEGIRRVQQDWVIRQWPQNFTHWMPLPPPPTHGIEPEQGEAKS